MKRSCPIHNGEKWMVSFCGRTAMMKWTDAIRSGGSIRKLSAALGSDEVVVLQARQIYSLKCVKDSEELVADVSALLFGGELSENVRTTIGWQRTE